MSRPLLIIASVVLALVVLLAAGAGLVWWKVSSFKEHLIAGLGKSLGAEVQVGSLEIDPWKREIHAADITLINLRPSAPWDKGEIAQATIKFHLHDLFSSSIPLAVEISSWNLTLHSPLRTAEAPSDATSETEPAPDAHPARIHVTQISAREGTVTMDFSDDRKVTVHGVAFDALDDGGSIWTTDLQATSIEAGTFASGACSVHLRGDPDQVAFSDLRVQCAPGAITGDGEIGTTGSHDAKLTLKVVQVPVVMLVALAWQPELSGLANVDLTYTGNDQGGQAQGNVSIDHGKFNVLPWLGKVTSLVGLPDISGVELDKATSDFTWKDRALHLTNLDLRKDDVTRIAGSVDVDPAGNVDGHLHLGLPSAILGKFPQVQTAVFPTTLEDYDWADVHLTGTAAHLNEDLTPRLVSAGLNQGGNILNQAAQQAGSLLNSLLGK
jgi:hypothetical protein